MFIPPKHIADQLKGTKDADAPVALQHSHLLIDQDIVEKHFGDCLNVFLAYYPNKRVIMLANVEDELFKNIHKASQYMLKDGKQGTKRSIAIHDLLIDNELDSQNRSLTYEANEQLKILTIHI